MARPFLTAAWHDLLLLNWKVERSLLQPHVPEGTELDPWEGDCYVSLVGFRFLDLAVKGLPAVGHRDFPEINLRFYVRREVAGEVRRGVVFICELTPHRIVEWVARMVYNEPYKTLPMRGEVSEEQTQYLLQQAGQWQGMGARPKGGWNEPAEKARDTFLIEHYWGYNRQSNGDTMEYEVTHPPWRTRPAQLARFDSDVESLYGPQWAEALADEPDAVVLAEGSEVAVFSGTRI